MDSELQTRLEQEIARRELDALIAQRSTAAPSGSRNADGTYGEPPAGMVLNPKTGQMEDMQSPANPRIPQGMGTAVALGLGQGVGFNLLDEAVGGISALTGGNYDYDVARIRGAEHRASEDHPVAYYGSMIGGGLGSGLSVAGAGLSAAANAGRAGASLGRVAMGSAADSAIFGGLAGIGSGEGAEGRAKRALVGTALGGVIGAGAPYAITGAQALANPLLRPIMSRLRPDTYAARALGEGLGRAGVTVDEAAGSLQRAQADGQGMFTVADAMGHSGQRMLSTVARTPNDMRQTVVETLTDRQMGQGDRLASFLAEGFNAPDTAAQRTASLTAQRAAAASANYGAARQGAGVVNPTRAIQAADDFLTPGAMGVANPGNNIADDSIEAAVRRARSYLTDGDSVLTDFAAAFRSKQEIDAMIERAQPSAQRVLIPIRNSLDEALERSSPRYAQARDSFRQQSRAIDAVDTGRSAASGRVRADDSVPQFNSMTPEEQAAFRAGYADPLIARVEATAISPTTNKARALMTPKTGEEFPAFAAPGQADRLGARIGREQRMFETANTALGGSKTADNLADAAEMAKFDPAILTNLFQRPIKTAIDVAARLMNEAQGMPPSVTARIAQSLLETNPHAARALLEEGAQTASQDTLRRALASMVAGQAGGATGGRLGTERTPLELTVRPRR